MYGMPGLTYGSEVLRSFNGLIEAIKCRQTQRPRSTFTLSLAGSDFAVNVLLNGCVEVDGTVPQLNVQKEIEDAMRQFGAVLAEARV